MKIKLLISVAILASSSSALVRAQSLGLELQVPSGPDFMAASATDALHVELDLTEEQRIAVNRIELKFSEEVHGFFTDALQKERRQLSPSRLHEFVSKRRRQADREIDNILTPEQRTIRLENIRKVKLEALSPADRAMQLIEGDGEAMKELEDLQQLQGKRLDFLRKMQQSLDEPAALRNLLDDYHRLGIKMRDQERRLRRRLTPRQQAELTLNGVLP